MPEIHRPAYPESMTPTVDQILERSRVVALPMAIKFRGVTTREALLIDGPAGWGEFSPFLEYDARESAAWLRAGLEAAFTGFPTPNRTRVEVNATVPAVPAAQVGAVLARYPGCRVFKVKVAEPGQTLAEDVARVHAVREQVPGARIRVDANCGWTVEEALRAAEALGPLDYMEQPVATVGELAQVRGRLQRAGIFCRIAADESIRRAEDPYLVAERQAADVAVVKVAPLGGVRPVVELAADLRARHLDITVASALDTAVGINAGLAAVAALPVFRDDDGLDVTPAAAGLATQRLFAADVAEPRPIVDGWMAVEALAPEPARLVELAAPAQRREWWFERVRAAHAHL